MARRTVTDMAAWPALTFEGNLIAPAMAAQIYAYQAAEQSEADYGLRKGLTLREEIATAFRVGQAHYDAFTRLPQPSVGATRRFVSAFLRETFGFHDLANGNGVAALVAGGRIPVVVVPPGEERLDRKSPTLSQDRPRSPAFALQDYLNEHAQLLWGLVTNGTQLRLVRDNASLTRPAYIEADLAQIFGNEDAASFSLLWLLLQRSRFGAAGAAAADCALERWRDAGAREGEAARDRLAGQVREALGLLGSGFLAANPALAQQLQRGELSLTDWFNELLRLVYRLIFLMVAEDRNLLHPPTAEAEARRLYESGYGLSALRRACLRAANWDQHIDRYEGLKIVFRALSRAEPALALPALGGLFSADQLPQLGQARLTNRALLQALYKLAWLAEPSGMLPVNWRAMETEELGSVYESLLELQPQLGDDGRTLRFASDAAEQKGNQRKTTGSYYTPDSLVQALLDSALDPVLNATEAAAEDPAAALLKLTVIDPACGSGHFLLASARRIATRVARLRSDGTPALSDFRHAMRDVARSCIYGVDRNPMAVELTRVALWIETVDPGLPLGFFDAQIRCGDSLLGVFDLQVLQQGIPDAAYKALSGDDKEVARQHLKANRAARAGQSSFDLLSGRVTAPPLRPLALDIAGLRAMPEQTVEQVGAKAERFDELRRQPAFVRARYAADCYVAAFLLPKVPGARLPTTEDVWHALNAGDELADVEAMAGAAQRARAFHWPLEFPDVIQRGGFDVVVGNPPWEVMQLGEEEYFASRIPEIALLSGAARKRAIANLEAKAPQVFADYVQDKRQFEAGNDFVRESGRFDLTARGKVNTYSLFAELFAGLARGRAGVIVPTGIATDATTAPFFGHLVEQRRLARLVDFENRAGLFPAVDSRMKFCIVILGRDEPVARFAFFLTEPAQLAQEARNFTLTPVEIATINPNTKTAPVFRARADAELTAKIYRTVPVLINEDLGDIGNPWNIEFRQGLFNMTSDSHLFHNDNGAGRLPLYEAKLIHQFDHRWTTYAGESSADVEPAQKRDPHFRVTPRYWVDAKEVEARLRDKGWQRGWLMGWRDITNATNERTVIAAVIPRVAVGHKMPLFLTQKGMSVRLLAAFYSSLNSLSLDYVARQKVGGTSLTYFYLKQFPILPPAFYTGARLDFVVPRVLELTYTAHDLRAWAQDLGYDGPPFGWDEARRAGLRAELDAFYARAYGLTRDELRYILDPADVLGPDYPSETFRVLKEKEQRQYGEYRTGRLVLAAWDQFEADGTFGGLGL